MGLLIVCADEGVDLVAQLAWRGEAGPGQGLAGEDGEPDFNLIEPGGVGRREVKMDVLVACQPAIVFGLMGVQIVENDMNLAVGIGGDDAVHEIQELDAATAPVMAGFDQTGGHFESRNRVVVPWRLHSWLKPVMALPLGSFSQPWARSSAWMCGFSSTASTTAFSGGRR